MGFKSRQLPSMVVHRSTPEMQCLLFRKKRAVKIAAKEKRRV
jgi:hypothetical protein